MLFIGIALKFVKNLVKNGVCYIYHRLISRVYNNIIYQIYTVSDMERSDSLMSESNEKERIQIFVSCRNLDDLDFITVTDSYLVITLVQNDQPPRAILKTKVYWNDLNPNYAQTVLIDFYFEIKQKLIFEVFHYQTPPKLVGRVETSVGEIFGSPQHGLVKDLLNKGKKAGKIIVRSEKEQVSEKKIATLKFRADGLPNITWWYFFGGTNSFFRIFRKRQNDELLVYESEVVPGTNPMWREFRISQRRLASNDQKKELEIRLYNFAKNGKHEIIGSAILSLSIMKSGKKYQILNRIKNPIGMLILDNYRSQAQYQFADFLQKGLQLALVTCIDFTASNGVPSDKKSLHYTGGGASAYEKALSSVANILLDYDYDKLVPVYGFGAKVKHPLLDSENKVHHCFPINGNMQNPNLFQLDAIVKAYRNIMQYIQLSGPTKFGQLLREAMQQCRDFQAMGTHYMILFILTDGQIHDKQEVIDLLVECNRLPMSVIIVGIGEGEFQIMHDLDDDNCEMIDSKGRRTQRDLVQFVQFAKFQNNGTALAKEVLEQLPRQVSEYFQLTNVSPDDIAKNFKQNDVERVKKFKESMMNPYDI